MFGELNHFGPPLFGRHSAYTGMLKNAANGRRPEWIAFTHHSLPFKTTQRMGNGLLQGQGANAGKTENSTFFHPMSCNS